MRNFTYWPYDEVSLRNEGDGRVVVSTPWLEASASIDSGDLKLVNQMIEKFSSDSLGSNDLILVQDFFQRFEKIPVCYILPTQKMDLNLDIHLIDEQSPVGDSFESILSAAIKSRSPDSPFKDALDLDEVISPLARHTSDWDVTSALQFASSGDGLIHPESVFSVARRFHFLDVLETNQGKQNFDAIENLSSKEFSIAAGIMVRQNHYVTQRCQSSLSPALSTALSARSLVEEFIVAERGHDRILGAAMRSFANDPESVPVSAQTKALMLMLEYAAQKNFLAFAMAVDFFERNSYEDSDPLAKLLTKGGFDKAAQQIDHHKDINDDGGHDNVACGFLQYMAPCSPEYALEALKIAELVSLLINHVPQSAMGSLYEVNILG